MISTSAGWIKNVEFGYNWIRMISSLSHSAPASTHKYDESINEQDRNMIFNPSLFILKNCNVGWTILMKLFKHRSENSFFGGKVYLNESISGFLWIRNMILNPSPFIININV